MRILSVFYSLSGNSMLLASRAEAFLLEAGHDVTSYYLNPKELDKAPHLCDYDFGLLTTYTIDWGSLPEEFKQYVARNRKITTPIAVMGTGDSLWGEENYCGGADRLATFYRSPYPVFKTEYYVPAEGDQSLQQWIQSVLQTTEITSNNSIQTIHRFAPEYTIINDFLPQPISTHN